MSYFGVAVVSIALVLLNVGIGCALADKDVRGRLGPIVRRLLHPRRSADE